MEILKYHINDFPQERVFVYLEECFHRKLFLRIKKYKFKVFNDRFFGNQLNWSTFKQWRSRKHFIPLWFVVKLSEFFPSFSISEFEKNIVAIKGPSTSKIIEKPNLPLPEDKRLIKVLAHFLGDGYVGGAFGSRLPKGKSHSEYRNFCSDLLDNFEKDLQVFGSINLSKDYSHGHIIIPNLVGYVLKHLYKIDFGCFNSRLPKRLFELPRELVSSFFRAFGDDEGHVYDSSIDYYSNNKKLLADILLLMNNKFPEIRTS